MFKEFIFNESIPNLVIDGIEYFGINILEKLSELRSTSNLNNYQKALVYNTYAKVSNFSATFNLPKLGYILEDSNAIRPIKSIDNVGFDLSIIKVDNELTSKTFNKITVFDTGVSFKIPLGYYLQLHPRSSIIKSGYMLANSTGIIDPSYTGSIKVPLIKVDESCADIALPSRIVQVVLTPYANCNIHQEYNKFSTSRDCNGFGSSDIKK